MAFNSIDFAVFLPLVFLLYWFVFQKNLKTQNYLLVFASCLFYGWWNWMFLGLICLSTAASFILGLGISQASTESVRRFYLILGAVLNLGVLGFFKYYNFFIYNVLMGFSLMGVEIDMEPLKIILPVGISFFTFQSLSYLFDVYRRHIVPTKDPVAFFAFVAFFPQLVAGPIERAKNLLPQMTNRRHFNAASATDGMRLILWGLFKKVVVADNCAILVNQIFEAPDSLNGAALLLGAFFFSFQIYGDFSGYSDMAIGIARLFGFDLMRNFAFPYFSENIAEFWKKWHISLSTWFRDYVYIPLGGNRKGKTTTIRNVFIVFLISGLWHGANWTFLAWGIVHALLFLPYFLGQGSNHSMNKNTLVSYSLRMALNIGFTFFLTTLAWVFFRSDNIAQAWIIFERIFSPSLFSIPNLPNLPAAALPLVMILLLLTIEWIGRNRQHALEVLGTSWAAPGRWALYCFILSCIYFFGGPKQGFIYFQF
jgi:D-alanyl-lipoteichoic acid acyltransferase DltB (MBOAT superfamily)